MQFNMNKFFTVLTVGFLTGSLPVLADSGDITVNGTDYTVLTSYSISSDTVDSLPSEAVALYNGHPVYASGNGDGLAFLIPHDSNGQKVTSGAVLGKDILIRCKTTDNCVPSGIESTVYKISKKSYRITVADFAEWQNAVSALDGAEGVAKFTPSLDYGMGVQVQ